MDLYFSCGFRKAVTHDRQKGVRESPIEEGRHTERLDYTGAELLIRPESGYEV